ncbi:hypothetical protein GOQ28_14955 [Bordetella sp. 02P26C-1]|nr:hypothetical protein [Bordetella sp. 02P26C-1]
MSFSLRLNFLTAAVTISLAGPALAQDAATAQKLAEFGGQMHAVAVACGDYTPSQLSEMKAEQQRSMATSGLSAAEFETAFQQGLQATQKKIASGTAQQRTQMCEQFSAAGKR